MKQASLSQNVVRRLLNTHNSLKPERIQILNSYTNRLLNSGYSRTQVKGIMLAGLKVYKRYKREAERRGDSVHRSSEDTREQRRDKTMTGKLDWYHDKERHPDSPKRKARHMPSSQRPNKRQRLSNDTVLFVPRTKNGNLISKLRQTETNLRMTGHYKIKLVEEARKTLREVLHKADPWGGKPCNHDDCILCDQARREDKPRSDCKTRSTVYRTTCLLCKADNKRTTYTGETGRTTYERLSEHVEDAMTGREKSHMIKHMKTNHKPDIQKLTWNDIRTKFKFEIIAQHTRPLQRQLREATLIQKEKQGGNQVMNDKREYNRCIIPTLMVEDPRLSSPKAGECLQMTDENENDTTEPDIELEEPRNKRTNDILIDDNTKKRKTDSDNPNARIVRRARRRATEADINTNAAGEEFKRILQKIRNTNQENEVKESKIKSSEAGENTADEKHTEDEKPEEFTKESYSNKIETKLSKSNLHIQTKHLLISRRHQRIKMMENIRSSRNPDPDTT